MIPNERPYLFVRRLVVVNHQGGIAYDQEFNQGVNIIRGKNSSGKSTISNLIFFSLGGDYNNWNPESARCSEVYVEVEINSALYTLKRTISMSLRQHMTIYWGNFITAKKDNLNWKVFPYQQTEDKVSYSNIIFNALNYPSVKSETDNNITLHQILRLIYIDQDSPTQSLFRRENFDQPLTREAISELLLGVYDSSLYENRILLRQNKKELDSKQREYESISRAYVKAGNPVTSADLSNQIQSLNSTLEGVEQQISELKNGSQIRIAKNSKTTIEEVQNLLRPAKENFRNVSLEVYQLDLDIVDSRSFVETLQKRVIDLQNSITTRKVLGEISLELCPQCLNPLKVNSQSDACSLCKEPLSDDEMRTHAKRVKQELELQIKESKALLVAKEKKVEDLRAELPTLKEAVNYLQKELNKAVDDSQSTRDDRQDKFLIIKGNLENEIKNLLERQKGIDILEQLRKEISILSEKIAVFELDIKVGEANQVERLNTANSKISEITKYILKNDLLRQNEFLSAKSVDVDFYDDKFSLDGNFNFSASSNTYLKNAIRFAIFFASLRLDFMRYPRFIICDNMEDKGMEKERTQNFQNQITSLSDKFQKEGMEHQIIFTTSMISAELEGTSYCIGEYYNEENKTLKL